MTTVNKQDLQWLTSVAASDLNFKSALERAGAATILAALKEIAGQEGHKTREKALKARLNKITQDNHAMTTQAAEQVVEVEVLRETSAASEQANKEALIAQCHELIGRIQASQLIAKFSDVGSLVWLKEVKETKAYRDVPDIGSWDKFCNYIGLSR